KITMVSLRLLIIVLWTSSLLEITQGVDPPKKCREWEFSETSSGEATIIKPIGELNDCSHPACYIRLERLQDNFSLTSGCGSQPIPPLTAQTPAKCQTSQEDLTMECFCMATDDNKLCNSILQLFDSKGTVEQKNRNTFLRAIGINVSTRVNLTDGSKTGYIEFDADFRVTTTTVATTTEDTTTTTAAATKAPSPVQPPTVDERYGELEGDTAAGFSPAFAVVLTILRLI
ncbi:hypothetical protein PENTCL1PPCAC_24475, partial [Pristionchus entomophagus]